MFGLPYVYGMFFLVGDSISVKNVYLRIDRFFVEVTIRSVVCLSRNNCSWKTLRYLDGSHPSAEGFSSFLPQETCSFLHCCFPYIQTCTKYPSIVVRKHNQEFDDHHGKVGSD